LGDARRRLRRLVLILILLLLRLLALLSAAEQIVEEAGRAVLRLRVRDENEHGGKRQQTSAMRAETVTCHRRLRGQNDMANGVSQPFLA
jgi:hypothetical protein